MAATAVAATAILGAAKSTTTPPKPAVAAAAAALPCPPNRSKRFAIPIPGANPSPHLPSLSYAAVAAAVFSSLSSSDAAFAAQQIADIADGDSRGLALLIPIAPAIAWVLFNILQPALNQINRMRSSSGFAVGIGIAGGLVAGGLAAAPRSAAGEMAVEIAEAAAGGGDNRGLLLLVPVGVAVLWVLFNILQPALNQINRMRSG
ncbi:Photosystem II core complex proteins psbY, chloroplastic [Apostasia shenzhenica]|uniref:Photosystem II core complex proteins psbY, chloroplastic n=1 Tax=Apostasia shenzhenica TaxID=1088818 RepID=A0A2I0AQU6_9ASPA|nr:Photosystem II core complex proteins psbY, chloroplastic [Apostasia shenzhenica]